MNEAPLILAGFAYHEVTSIQDLPESFSAVINQYARSLNDAMPEGDVLNRLRPFATRLSGSSDGRRVANARGAFLALQAARVYAPLALEAIDMAAAKRLRAVATPEDAMAELSTLAEMNRPNNVREAVRAAHRALSRTFHVRDAIYTAELSAVCAIRAAAMDEHAWDKAIETLDALLAIGKQADPIEVDLMAERAAKVLAVA